MNITLRTPDFELVIDNAEHDEALDTLALLVNAGVIPTAEGDFVFVDEEDLGDCCGACDSHEENGDGEDELTPEEAFAEILEVIAKTIEQAVKEEEARQEEQPQAPQTPEELAAQLEKQFGKFFQNGKGVLF